MAGFWKRTEQLPAALVTALGLGSGEKVLAHARDLGTGSLIVATNHRIAIVAEPDELLLHRPWHAVDAGTWDRETQSLTVTWADGSPSLRWRLEASTVLLQVVRERVQASVILTDELTLPNRRKARVALRQDLATGAILDQVVTRRPMDLREPQAAAMVQVRLAQLRSEIGA